MKQDFAKFDYYVQLILLGIVAVALMGTFVSLNGLIVALGAWFLLGAWQTILSFIYAIRFKDPKRKKHLSYVLAFILVGLAASVFARTANLGMTELSLLAFFMLGASLWLAIWCFMHSDKAREAPDPNQGYEFDDLLDEGEIKERS